MLKFKLDSESFDKLNEVEKTFYNYRLRAQQIKTSLMNLERQTLIY